MQFDNFLRREVASLVAEMDRLYADTTIQTLPEVSEAIDTFLLMELQRRLRDNCPRFVPGCVDVRPSRALRVRGIDFEILIGERVATYDELDVAFIRRDVRENTRVVPLAIENIETEGRFRKLVVEAAAELSVRGDLVARYLSVLITAVYRWLNELVSRLVAAEESALTRALYATFRSACLNEPLRQTLVFAAITSSRALYLVDHSYAQHALAIAARDSSAVLETPVRLLSEILNCDVPYELVAGKAAIETGRVKVADLRRARYRDAAAPLLPIAEAVIVGSTSVAIYPIVREGEEFLIAVAPGHHREELQHALRPILPSLADQFGRNRGVLSKLLVRVHRRFRTGLAGDLAELAGRFSAGILHAH